MEHAHRSACPPLDRHWSPRKPLFEERVHARSAGAYRVGSANFSQRKIGHVHDNSADSGNVAGVPQRSVHAHFIFRFEKGLGNQSCFLSTTKMQLKRVNHKLSRRTIGAPWAGRVRQASSGPSKSLIQHGLVGKKKTQTSWIEESLC